MGSEMSPRGSEVPPQGSEVSPWGCGELVGTENMFHLLGVSTHPVVRMGLGKMVELIQGKSLRCHVTTERSSHRAPRSSLSRQGPRQFSHGV